ncbi:hypothetical protein N7G274_002993 [Stereocaulon virgatum]|uniref:tRNA(Phe) (4-demethylwyosine(37)-C(7)) aminocarboxypropyltransferase n=1 Tax=Stereocaulon virgatum TaxID=373712 RepID=A0ABR4ALH7_9LECA
MFEHSAAETRTVDDSPEAFVALIVPKGLVKRTKDALKAQQRFNRKETIRSVSPRDVECVLAGSLANLLKGSFHVPTNFQVGNEWHTAEHLRDLVKFLGLQEHEANISLVASPSSSGAQISKSSVNKGGDQRNMNPLARTVSKWLALQGLDEYHPTANTTLRCKWTYIIYPPLLLLPNSDFSTLKAAIALKPNIGDFATLNSMLCEAFKVTHIALNAPIPASVARETPIEDSQQLNQLMSLVNSTPNILRSPTGLTPLHGNFGPILPTGQVPTKTDFAGAFWCTARQNGIFQTWAPRYTMFSRGNITEKVRIFELASRTEARLGVKPQQTSAVDLYAGIGYFAFSYAKAGVGKVLCWEINPWSVEGLRRGTEGSKWNIKIIKSREDSEVECNKDEKLVIFQESNDHAATRVEQMRDKIPPVTHVNCGYLPSSLKSWEVAVQVLDPVGGWIHAHENVAQKNIEDRKEQIVMTFKELMTTKHNPKSAGQHSIHCEHVEMVKSYAPGVLHCVFDIAIFRLTSE